MMNLVLSFYAARRVERMLSVQPGNCNWVIEYDCKFNWIMYNGRKKYWMPCPVPLDVAAHQLSFRFTYKKDYEKMLAILTKKDGFSELMEETAEE